MRKIINPFLNTSNGHCFGCSPQNTQGLQMQFLEDGDEIISIWSPKSFLSGFENVLHGGIQTTLMDEIACWYVFVKLGTCGVTTHIDAKFRGTLFTDQGDITISAKLEKLDKKFAVISTKIMDHNGTLCAEAKVQYMIYPLAVAKRKFDYPGKEAFFE